MTLPPSFLWLKSSKNTFHKEGKKLEQKTINQNKLLTLLCAVALTFGILVSAVLFSVTPVHAEEPELKYLSILSLSPVLAVMFRLKHILFLKVLIIMYLCPGLLLEIIK